MVIFPTVGGALCLDFANTVSQRREGPLVERLHSYGDLLDWAVQLKQLTAGQAERLRARAAQEEPAAAEVLTRARALREAIYRVFAARAHEEAIAPADLRAISAEYARAASQRVLLPNAAGEIDFEFCDDDALDRPLWPVAVSAANLASSDDATRVKECATDNCNWLFFDASKNRSRRWCEMKECGNRAKARRHYEKRRR